MFLQEKMGKLLYPTDKIPGKMLSVVLPAYNEEKNIKKVVDSILKFIPSLVEKYEIIIVNDGSKDDTGKLVDELAKNCREIVPLHHTQNRGYGAALTTGFKKAKGDFIFFTDADGQFDIKELPKLLSLIKEGADIACGYRKERADPLFRRINAGIYNLLIRVIFGLKVKDIDCAFKLFKRKIIEEINLESSGAFVSAEFLILAKKRGYVIKQVGVSHFPRIEGKQTGNNLKVVLKAFLELIKFRRKIKKKG